MDNTYWNSNGKYQAAADALHLLVPTEGAIPNPRKNKALEKFRNATNCYYDLYNNGLCNRKAQFARVFGFGASRYAQPWVRWGSFDGRLYERVETQMNEIIMAAAVEQKLDRHCYAADLQSCLCEVPL